VVQARGWRWTLWTALILTAVIYPLVLCTRETYEKTIMLRRERYNRAMNPSKALPKSSSLQAAKAFFSGNFVRPLHMLFTEPIVAAFGIYLLFILASFFLMIAAIPYVFYTVYGFDTRSQGLVFLSFVVGFLLASAMINMLWHLVAKKAKNASTSSTPDSRLALAKTTSILLPVSLFWFGWSAQCHAPWISPVVAVGLLAVNTFLLFVCHDIAHWPQQGHVLTYKTGAVFTVRRRLLRTTLRRVCNRRHKSSRLPRRCRIPAICYAE
jgi:MFS transporter, DHA1 family, multidrug resistance protein